MLAASDVGHAGCAAGGNEYIVSAVALAGNLDRVRVNQTGPTFNDLHARVFEQLQVNTVQPRDLVGAAGFESRPVKRRCCADPAEAVRLLERFG